MAKAKAKAKAKRYTPEEKQEILDFIASEGRGGQTRASKKYGVTPATIAAWKRKAAGGSGKGISLKGSSNSSKELRALENLAKILNEISATEVKLEKLRKEYNKAKNRL